MDGPRESFYSSIMFFSTAGELLLCVSPRLLFLIRKEQYSSLHLKLHLRHRRNLSQYTCFVLVFKVQEHETKKQLCRYHDFVCNWPNSGNNCDPAVFLFKWSIPEILGAQRCLYSICFSIVSKTTPSIIVSNFTHHYKYWAYLVIVNPIFHRTTVSKRKIILTFGILGCIFFICAAKIWT